MKVLHVTQNYFPSVGGPQYVMKHVSEKLIEYYEDEVEVCTTNSLYAPESQLFKKVEPAFEVINKVKVHRVPFNRWHYPLIKFSGKVYGKLTNKQLPFNISKQRMGIDSPAMKRTMANTNADVIMAKTIAYNFADYPLWRFKTSNPKPFILYGALHLHVDLPANSPALIRACACDHYLANTNFEKQKLIEYGVDKNKISAIGIGITIEHFSVDDVAIQAFKKKYNLAETDVVIGYIGRLVKGKGVPMVIDAFRKAYKENKNLKLLLAGGMTEYVPEIKRIIDVEKLPIILIVDFEEEMKSLLYNTLDIFILASQSESFGIVFLEAWACKKPVIAARMGATSSLLNEEVDSLLFEPKDVDSLCRKLTTLVENPQQRLQLGLNGFKKVSEDFTWPTIIAKYREAYTTGIESFNRHYKLLKN